MQDNQDDIPAQEPDSASNEATDDECVAARRSRERSRRTGYWVWLAATSIIIGSVLLAGGWVIVHRKPAPVITNGDDSTSTTGPESLPSAPPLIISIAGPAAGEAAVAADCQRALSKMAIIVAALGPDLQAAGASSADAVALPDERQAGKVAPPPVYQRWEVRVAPGTSQETYGRGLDFFGIELGVIGGGKEIVYLSKFSQPKPTQRTGPGRSDRRIYMVWQGGDAVDQAFALRAGIDLQNKVIAQFYPPEVEKQLAALELAYAEAQQHEVIEKTTFAMKADGEKFVFYVMDQQAGKQ